MDSDSKDLTDFDKSLSGLFGVLKSVIKTHETRKLNFSSKKNPILTRLERYIKIYDRTEPSEHVWYFKKIYNSNHSAILRGPDKDSWLINGNINIHFGEETGRPIKDAKVHLSIIYTTSIKLRDETEESLRGLPDVDQSDELLYPSIILFHLYSIFNEIAKDEDTPENKSKLSEYIKTLAGEIPTIDKPTSKKTGSDDPLGGIMNVAGELMGQLGIQMPEGQKMPSGNELSKMLNGAMKNPQAKSMIGSMMKEMQECDNIGDVVTKMLGKLGGGFDSAALNSMKQNINNASQDPNNQDPNEGVNEGDNNEGEEFEDEFLDN